MPQARLFRNGEALRLRDPARRWIRRARKKRPRPGPRALSSQSGVSDQLALVIVFAAFAFARTLLAQAVGLGLAVAVLVDATVVRLMIVPAFMHLAGRWNWWPQMTQIAHKRREI